MPFASINSSNPRTNPLNSYKRILRIDDFEKLNFFETAIFILFFQKKKKMMIHFHENQSKVLGYQEWVEILTITLVSSQKSLPPNISAASVVPSN